MEPRRRRRRSCANCCAAAGRYRECRKRRWEQPSIPLNHDRNLIPLIVEGRETRSKQHLLVERSDVTPDYFHLLEIPLLGGRLFSDRDNETAPQVAVVNEAMAGTYWRGEDPLGKRLKVGGGGPGGKREQDLDHGRRGGRRRSNRIAGEASIPQIYLSLYQTKDRWPSFCVDN